jgi:putative MATE family efflux protein
MTTRRDDAPARASAPDFDDLETAEGAPAIPAAALAAHAAAAPRATTRVSDAEIWALAWPVILSQVLASAVSLVDIGMVGQLGRTAVAAVGYATQYLWLAQSVLFAIGVACVAMMARAVGAGEPARARQALAASLGVSVAIGVGVGAAAILAPHGLLAILGAEEAIVQAGLAYFQLSVGSTALLAISITIESGFRAVRDMRTPMAIALAVTVAKIGLNWLLMFGALGAPRMELAGAGLATVLSQVLGVALFWIAAAREGSGLLRVRLRDATESPAVLGEVVRISIPAVGERVIMNAAMMSYYAMLGRYGTAALAAYTIGVRLLSFSWIPGTGFSVAASTLVGQALGASEPAEARRAGVRSLWLSIATSIALGVLFVFIRDPLARVFTSDAGVVDELGPFMFMLAIAQPLLGIHFTLAGALRGAGDTWTPLVAATLGNWAFRVPLAFVVSRVLELPVTWVWATLVLDHLARSAWLWWEFQRGRWQARIGVSTRASA